jgi:hypothetical protein
VIERIARLLRVHLERKSNTPHYLVNSKKVCEYSIKKKTIYQGLVPLVEEGLNEKELKLKRSFNSKTNNYIIYRQLGYGLILYQLNHTLEHD